MSAAAALTPEAFIAHWQKAEANERANSQSFLLQLTQMLGVPAPSNTHDDGYSFEFPVKVPGTGKSIFGTACSEHEKSTTDWLRLSRRLGSLVLGQCGGL